MSTATSPCLKIYGQASGKIFVLSLNLEQDSQVNLMSYLLQNNIPVASSCNGEGICKKCLCVQDLLTCSLTLGELFAKFANSHKEVLLGFSYL